VGFTPNLRKKVVGILLPYPSTAGGWKQKEYMSMQPPEIRLLVSTTDPILPDLQFRAVTVPENYSVLSHIGY
jgi:hypothetical protein